MGADNLVANRAQWSRWQQIFHIVPVAIFDRPSYSLGALTASSQVGASPGKGWPKPTGRAGWRESEPPAWVFLHMPLNPQSATHIRATSRHRRQIRGPAETRQARCDEKGRTKTIASTKRAMAAQKERSASRGAAAPAIGSDPHSRTTRRKIPSSSNSAGKSTIADYMVIASGRSQRHAWAPWPTTSSGKAEERRCRRRGG